jgi:rare lipoprotein A
LANTSSYFCQMRGGAAGMGTGSMRSCVFVLTLTLAVLNAPQTRAAQTASAGVVPVKEISSGSFPWFVAQLRSEDTCEGQLVVATWYASDRRTASGQAFNPDDMTAAHRTLPLGSRLTVTNPRNGKSVAVVINDRGPFKRGITLDLARGAARAIGMKDRQWVCMSEISR